MTGVVTLEPTAVEEVVDVLHESFYDYPVMRFVLAEGGPGYEGRLRTLVRLFVMARVFRNEVLLGVPSGDGLTAAALVSRPGRSEPSPGYIELRQEVWSQLGDDARDRYERFGATCAPFAVDRPHLHLNMIGVRRHAQGRGLSRELIEAVHELSRTDDQSTGVSLTTEDPRNVGLYRHFGYEIVGEGTVAPDLTTWGFFRPD